ncbi:MAG: glycosyltransferase, partial [Deltaproteobacteria bacterium]|nr:glycosyltransferase [Deltaproteobacteria bacterium]
MILFLEFLVAASLSACFLQLYCTWRSVKRARRNSDPAYFTPPISILKPLKGVDDRLLDNLAGFCRLDYPKYEIIFCLHSPSDPALRVVNKVRELFPDREISVAIGDFRAGLNPKVNNMIPGYEKTRYPFVLISDSNVSVRPGYLKEAISHFRDPRVGLVNHLVRGVGGRSAGARLDNGHLNTFILGSVCLLDRMFGIPCVVGKSMLMRKQDLDALGGLHAVKDFLAEDYTLGAMFKRAGGKVVISGQAVDAVTVYRGVRQFLSRHARWNRMRFSIAGPAYLMEILSNPLFLAFLLVGISAGSREGILAAGLATACKLAMDAAMNVLLGSRLGIRGVALGPVRDLLAAGLWFSAFYSRTVEWR